jgi:hypothetical protein
MKRVSAFWGLAGGTNVEPVGDGNVHMLIRTFGHATADNGKVFFLIAARRMGIDECGFTGFQFAIANDAPVH